MIHILNEINYSSRNINRCFDRGISMTISVFNCVKKRDSYSPPSDKCAPPGQDVYDPSFLPDIKHPVPCCL